MNQIQIAAKLYECRDTCKRLWGNEWKSKVEVHTKLIHAAMKKHGIDNEIQAAMKLINDAKNMDGADVFTMKCLAAAVELVEPS